MAMTNPISVYLVTLKYSEIPEDPERIATARDQITAFFIFLEENNGVKHCFFYWMGTVVVEITTSCTEALKELDYVKDVYKDYQVSP